ncbi:MAG: RibD family protein [Thiotrichales bacterium]
MANVLRLFPAPHATLPLEGLYLRELEGVEISDHPFVYANFVSSLDGRIALQGADGKPSYVPRELSNVRDFRLFLELQAQADCLITHGGYLRALAERRLGNILQVGVHPVADTLSAWRLARGLSAQPDLVIASASLDFEIPPSIIAGEQRVLIATFAGADAQRRRSWTERGFEVITAGTTRQVEGRALVQALAQLGYRRLYLIAGPRMLDTMLRDRMLHRVYLTLSHQLLGGTDFHSLLPGPELGAAGRLQLSALYHDLGHGDAPGQWFARFDVPARRPDR